MLLPFLIYASGRRKPVHVLEYTNQPDITPESLLNRGYKLYKVSGLSDLKTEYWVHPSGKVVARKVSAKSKIQTSAEEEPYPIKDCRKDVKASTKGRNKLIKEIEWLKENPRDSEYCRRYWNYFAMFSKWQEELNAAIEYAKSILRKEVESQAQPILEKCISRLEALDKWKKEEWPKLIRDLQSCD